MPMFRYRNLLFFALFLPACTMQTTTDTGASKLSDASIRLFTLGQNILFSDSAAFNPNRTEAYYVRSDSTFQIFGYCWYRFAKFSAVIHAPLDTGTISLDFPAIPCSNYQVATFYPNGKSGNAIIYFSNGDWSTDSVHTGTITISSIDTINHTLNATFHFIAINTTQGSTDTVHVDHGVISNIRFYVN